MLDDIVITNSSGQLYSVEDINNKRQSTRMASDKKFNIKKWERTYIAQEMSKSEREWYIIWMKDYNEQLGQSRENKKTSN